MNIKAYIEGGILESYALGLCSDEEAREVEALCLQHAEVKAELDEVRKALENYASMHSRSPQPVVKERIFAELAHARQPKIIQLPANRYRFAIAASLALFALSFIANIIIYYKYQSVNEQVIALNAEKTMLADGMKTNQVKLEDMNKEMAVLTDPMVKKVAMKGVPKSPESLAMIYWNTASKEVFVEIKKLPLPEAGRQYQLWAIVDGKPVDAGMITMTEGDSTLHRMKDFASAQAFAVTLEKEGGSPAPTLTEMYVMGAVSL